MRKIVIGWTAIGMLIVGAPGAAADPTVGGEFALTGSSVGSNNQIALGPDGNMWVTLDTGNDLARITPAGAVTQFNPANITSPAGITAGPDGKLWVTQANGVASFDPANPNGAVATAIADITQPQAITVGPDTNLWTGSADKVVKIPPANPAGFTAYATGATKVVNARGIASSGGTLWIADFDGKVVSVTTAGVGTAYPVGGGSQGVAAGPGDQVGFTMQGNNPHTIGRITGGTVTANQIPQTDPFGIVLGTDGAYWAAQFLTSNLGRLTTNGQYSTLGGLSANSGPRQITTGPNNTLWVTLDTAEKIARIDGVTTPAPAPNPNPAPLPTSPKIKVTITKKPAKVVRTNKPKAKVTFRFKANRANATFQCRTKKTADFKKCKSPRKYKLRLGKYRFQVRAIVDGVRSAKTTKYKFRVVR